MDIRIDAGNPVPTPTPVLAERVEQDRVKKEKQAAQDAEQQVHKQVQEQPRIISRQDLQQFLLMLGSNRISEKLFQQIAEPRQSAEPGNLLNREA